MQEKNENNETTFKNTSAWTKVSLIGDNEPTSENSLATADIHSDETTEDNSKKNFDDHIKDLYHLCLEHYKLNKASQEKLLYWMASLAVITVTGVGFIQNKIKFAIFLHGIFFALWNVYLNKMLNADLFAKVGDVCATYIKNNSPLRSELPSFFELKNKYIGKRSVFLWRGSFSRVASIVFVILYLALIIIFPYSKLEFNDDTIIPKIEWMPEVQFGITASVIFSVFMVGSYLSYKCQQDKVIERIFQDSWVCKLNVPIDLPGKNWFYRLLCWSWRKRPK